MKHHKRNQKQIQHEEDKYNSERLRETINIIRRKNQC